MEKNASKRQKPRQNPKKQKKNHELAVITYLFVGLFVLMSGYFVYFEAVLRPDVINNPYNSRQETFAERVVRGNILASDGTVLARTNVAEDGTETREYPYGNLFARVVGYSTMGRTGIESLANFSLLTSNAFIGERISRELREEKNMGDSVVTTLDLNLQQTAYDALGNQKGAVVVLESSTGNVRALVSKPDYDPGEVAAMWGELSSSEDSVLLNRALQGLYPPGSTFKTITLLEYLREHPHGAEDYSFQCSGKVAVGNSSISCYHGTRHGELSLSGAFAKSCNSAFAEMGRSMDVRRLRNLTEQLLFDTELPLAFPYKKSSFSLKASDSEALHMMTAIGQGDTLVTPMHMGMIMGAIANDGVLMTPRFLERTESYTGQTVVERYPVTEYGSLLDAAEAEAIKEYLRLVVTEGTASALLCDPYTAYGKTGTAEYSSDKKKSHAWFTGYVTGDKPDLAVCVLVEGAGSGSEYAVPVAKKIFDAYYGIE